MPPPIDASRSSDAPPRDALQSIAAQLSSPGFSTGSLATLRRFHPLTEGRHCVFEIQRVLLGAGIDLAVDHPLQPRWALVVHCLAIVRGAHHRAYDTGAKLADLGLSEARLRQLIEADGPLLHDLLPALARRLAAARVTLDWRPLADLVLTLGDAQPERGQRARLQIVQGFLRIPLAKANA